MKDPKHLFTLRVRVNRFLHSYYGLRDPMIVIHAFEESLYHDFTHARIDVEVKQGGKVIFPKGFLYCGIPSHQSIDGIYAKEAVMSLVSMRPGDTDADYFKDYSSEQLTWAGQYGEELSIIREGRYCDKHGNVRK